MNFNWRLIAIVGRKKVSKTPQVVLLKSLSLICSFWCLKRFYEGLKGRYKTFWGTTKSKKIRIWNCQKILSDICQHKWLFYNLRWHLFIFYMLLFIIIISIIFVVFEYCSKSCYDIIPFINEIGFKETKTTWYIVRVWKLMFFIVFFLLKRCSGLCTNCESRVSEKYVQAGIVWRIRQTLIFFSHVPVKGLYVWCQGCGHGGHLVHLKNWFEKKTVCPAGCGHYCQYT